MTDLHERRNGSSKPAIVATYDYHDVSGVLRYQVVRFAPKDFRQRQPDGAGGWRWTTRGVQPLVYHRDKLSGRDVVLIPEGEKDVDGLWSVDLPATCNHGGAGKWGRLHTEQLIAAGVKTVVILPDNDEPGRAHAEAVARSCAAAGLKVKIVALPGLPAKGDVSDWLDAGHTGGELIELVKATPTCGENTTFDSLDLVTLSDVEAECVSWDWYQRLAEAKYTLLAGDPGVGKSTCALWCAAVVSRGSTWPDGGQAPQGRTLILSAEDGIADTIRPRIDRLGGDPAQIIVLRAVRDERGLRPLNLARDLDRLAEAIARVQPRLVIIDPITAYLGKTDSYKDAEVRGLLAPLLALLEGKRVALLAVGHLAKADQRAALHRPGGSIAFVAAARIVLCLAADPNDPDRRVLAGLKSNLGPLPASLAFRLPDGRMEWESGPVALDAETLLRPALPADREDQTDAEALIRELLDDVSAWPMEAAQAIKAGEAHGIPERTMRRTARRAGIQIKRLGFGRGGRWLWHRPTIPDTAPADASLSPDRGRYAAMEKPAQIADTTHIEDTITCTNGGDADADVLDRF